MAALRMIWSDGPTLLTVGSAVIMMGLGVVCCIAGICRCENTDQNAAEAEAASIEAVEHVDVTWMRAG